MVIEDRVVIYGALENVTSFLNENKIEKKSN